MNLSLLRMPPVSCVLPLAVVAVFAAAAPLPARAQTYSPPQPRRQFVTISYDWQYTHPLHFAEHPLEDLVGRPVAAAQGQLHDYETRDGAARINVVEFGRRTHGAGITVYPFGLKSGATLGIRGSIENLPMIRLAFEGDAPFETYGLTNGRAYDVGAGVFVIQSFLLAGLPDVSPLFQFHSDIARKPNAWNMEPALLGSMICFAGLFGIRNWTRQTSISRSSRLRLTSMAFTSLIGAMVAGVMETNVELMMTWAAVVSATVQIASAWQPQSQPVRQAA